jgi:hypothetical protein
MECATTTTQLANPALRIIQITKDQGVWRTGLDTSRLNLTIGYRAEFCTSFLLNATDSLDTEGAFLHDPARAYGHIRIKLLS